MTARARETIKSYDSQSDPNTAGNLASQAILSDKVDMILTSSTPETVNPVATKAEALGVPTICGNVPWQSWYANLGGNPTPGKSTFKPKSVSMYFLGVNDLCNSFVPMWNRIHARLARDKTVGCTFPNDSDGNAFRAAWPLFAGPAGYKLVDPPAYTDGLTNYSSMINLFKSNNCDFFTNVPLPPDFNVMWKQAAQLGFKPKLATVAKVLLFPSDVKALATWSSSSYSLFEAAYAAFTSVSDPHDKAKVSDALFKVNIQNRRTHDRMTSPLLDLAHVTKRFGRVVIAEAFRSRSGQATRSGSWGRTVLARPACSASAAPTSPPPSAAAP